MFDWVGIDRKQRPTITGVRAIARDVVKEIERDTRAIQMSEDAG
jgi:hypothetical protein